MSDFLVQHREHWEDRGLMRVLNRQQLARAFADQASQEAAQAILADPGVTDVRLLSAATGRQLTIERLE